MYRYPSLAMYNDTNSNTYMYRQIKDNSCKYITDVFELICLYLSPIFVCLCNLLSCKRTACKHCYLLMNVIG